MIKGSGWDQRLVVGSGGKGLVGHAGAILLRKCADRAGLTSGLSRVLPRGKGPGWWDRGTVLVSLAVAIVLGATSMSDIGLLTHQGLVFGDPPSEATVRRALASLDETALKRIGKARARVRARVRDLLACRIPGFPWLSVAGKLLTGWVVIDMDATLITAHSPKQGAAATFKRGFGFHPLGAWCANTAECLAMLLRPGNAGSNTAADHIRVLGDAIAQLPAGYRRKLLIRVDGAGATHDLLAHLEQMNRVWRSVTFTVGWTITAADETAIGQLPPEAWTDSLGPDGTATSDAHVAELTGLNTRLHAWTGTLRLLVRRVKPSARHTRNLTDLEKRTGWRYQIVATNITRIAGVPGSHQPQWLDALHRAHAGVEDQVRHAKAMGLRNLPSQAWTVNRGWVLTCNIAADLTAWTRLPGLHDQPDLAHAEPATLRYRLLHLPANLAVHARRRVLSVPETWPWAEAFLACWQHLNRLPLTI